MTKNSHAFCLVASLALVAPIASAATLDFTGTPATITTVDGYNPSPDVPLQTPLSVYSATAGSSLSGGLYLELDTNERAKITYTVVGQESGFFNFLVVEGSEIPETPNLGLAMVSMNASGLLNFGFSSNRTYSSNGGTTQSIINGGISEVSAYKLGFGQIDSPDSNSFSLYSYFGDGTGDSDFDDIVAKIDVEISAVPLPAGMSLLLAGIGGLGIMARRKRKTA